MSVALTTAGICFLLLIIYARLTTLEARAGKRFFLSNIRFALDNLIIDIVNKIGKGFRYVAKYIITLSWYYSLHAFLRLILKFLAGIYYVVEKVLHTNRDKARQIRQERKRESRSHLEVLTDHKSDNKLSESEKKRLKDKAMSGK